MSGISSAKKSSIFSAAISISRCGKEGNWLPSRLVRSEMKFISERAFTGERVRKELRSPAEPIIDLDDILRDALGHLLSNETRYGPVVDGRGRMVGVLSMDTIGHSLHVPAEETRTSTELLADE